ncbi:amidohydrolase [Aquibacillus sediminis]|uniref:amidohydrolase n=1 Tax=Aquibacillus sediminis TaxID=2574734 RepID=UPI00110892FE|nr:amidohydrolase [Aquibacillus sediminis]
MEVADLIFFNGNVITVDQQFSIHQAIAVKDHLICGTGASRDILANFKGEHTKVIDLDGRSLLPGFIDAHAHLELYGTNKLGVNCKELASIKDIQATMKQVAASTKQGDWIRGWGYNQNALKENRHPTRWDLDHISTDHPIIITRTCNHISVVNSKALELAGIDENTPDPDGGKIGREDGVPNGLLFEAAHMQMFLEALYPEDQIMEGLQYASEDYIEKGITSVHDAGGYTNHHFRHLAKAVQQGKIKLRVHTLIGSLNDSPGVLDKALEAGMVTGTGDDRYRIGPAKVFIDGSSSGPTAKTREPYTSNPDDSGILYLSQDELNHILGKAHDYGWQITAHAIGDQAVEMLIETIETALEKAPRNDHRHRIEHAGITPPDLVERISDSTILPVPNPAFIYEFGDGYLQDYGDRVRHMFPIRSFLDAGIMTAVGSDSPITSFNPLVGIWAAITRQTKQGAVVGPEQKISVEEAIRLYTLNGAYASFEEEHKGSLEVGKLADLVVLNGDILSVPTEDIKEMQVDITLINGEIVYQNKKVEV